MTVCAGSIEQFDFATPIGFGLIDSAINLTDLIIQKAPKKIIFVGTAGSYGEKNPLELFSSIEATQIELSALQNQSYSPIANRIRSNYKLPLESVTVNCSNYITTDFQIATKFLAHEIHLENMEFFSVLSVAKEFEIPAFGIFVVTNYTNENAHSDFIKNHKEAMNKLVKYLEDKNIIKEAK